ncbi:hypothetical protein HMN09_01122800 [Mycena chlorophos]|uniref:BTB domain-containing protein n=1 Tax=Mycena chlorophos TaxID=658473 RepID=A0A8H6VVS3_MYCCL|nr:hypothetical protein HMN09_01122800 [Mycena chlorophos]
MDQSDDLTRVPALWFDDGTLVVRAQTTLFKVHRSVLSARSSVFHDMLAFPQDNGGLETFEGCPIVALPDEAQEVQSFLLAIYDSSYFMPPPQPFDILSLLGILRLAHKYDVEYLFKRALSHFDGVLYFDDYPAFLQAAGGPGIMTPQAEPWRPQSQYTDPRLLLAVVDALTQVEAQWLLPVAQYFLSSLPMLSLLGIPEDLLDGSRLRRILLHRQKLVSQRSRLVGAIVPWGGDGAPDGMECKTFDDCTDTRVDFLTFAAAYTVERDARALDQLDAGNMHGLCASCASGTFWEQSQNDFWRDDLPDAFDLPGWEDLCAQRAAMLGL